MEKIKAAPQREEQRKMEIDLNNEVITSSPERNLDIEAWCNVALDIIELKEKELRGLRYDIGLLNGCSSEFTKEGLTEIKNKVLEIVKNQNV